MTHQIEKENVIYFSYRGDQVPVDKAIVQEIRATAKEAKIDPAEFIDEIVEKTYQKLNDERLKVRQKCDELMAKLQALKTRGLQQVSKIIEAELNFAKSSAENEKETRNDRRSSSVSSDGTRGEGRFKVSRSDRPLNNENDPKSSYNITSENVNDTTKNNNNDDRTDSSNDTIGNKNSKNTDESKEQSSNDPFWAPMILNNMMLSNFGNICQNMTSLTKEEEFGNWKRQLKLVLRGQGLEDLISKKVPSIVGLPEVAIK